MNLKYFSFSLFFILLCLLDTYIAERVSYIITERPKVVYFDKKFIKNVTILSRRYNRKDPLYYINMYVESLMTIGNNASIDLFFYELQANIYLRTFIEMHSKLCDFMFTSTFFGNSLKKAVSHNPCPFQAGHHHFPNLTIPLKSIPKSFPYMQGRLFFNVSIDHGGLTSRLGEAYIDLEVKVASGNKIIKLQ